MKKLLIAAFLFLFRVIQAQTNDFPREINLVFDFMIKKDYPELFNHDPLRFRPVAWQIIDIDDDGTTEVFLQSFPHYNQSPTITIFQIDKNDSIVRITEGFAPGHLIAPSTEDDYLDPHSTATAIDMQLGTDKKKFRVFAEATLKYKMSIVLYNNFVHTDKRDGEPVFIDLMYVKDYPSVNTCEPFQFSKPQEIIAGKIKNQSAKFFIAQVGKELYCYHITGFTGNTFVEKEIKVIKTPKDYQHMRVLDGFIQYENKKGEWMDLHL